MKDERNTPLSTSLYYMFYNPNKTKEKNIRQIPKEGQSATYLTSTPQTGQDHKKTKVTLRNCYKQEVRETRTKCNVVFWVRPTERKRTLDKH